MTKKLPTGQLPALGEDTLTPRELQIVDGYLAAATVKKTLPEQLA